jgi:hypothetical protein
MLIFGIYRVWVRVLAAFRHEQCYLNRSCQSYRSTSFELYFLIRKTDRNALHFLYVIARTIYKHNVRTLYKRLYCILYCTDNSIIKHLMFSARIFISDSFTAGTESD